MKKSSNARASARALPRAGAQSSLGCHEELTALLPWLRRWAQRKWPALDPDDIIQDAFLRLLKAPPDREVQNAKVLLMHIARTVAIDHIRRAKVRSICVSLDESEYDKPCPEPLVDERLSAHQRLGRVLENLEQLPERNQKVVTLRRLEGMPARAVAAELGVSVSTVEKLLTASIRLLALAS